MRLANLDGRATVLVGTGSEAGVLGGFAGVDLATASGGVLPADPQQALERWDDVLRWWRAHRDGTWTAQSGLLPPDRLDPVRLGAPSPRPRQVFAIGLNYAPHAAEAGFVPPEQPLVFTKFPSCITGPCTTVALPLGRVDWEVELVVVLGREAYQLAPEQAWQAVAGLTVGQDLSERVTQQAGRPAQFSLGKSFPGFGPTGPYLVTPDELADPDDLAISCAVNGQTMQSARTTELIFPVADLVARLSQVCRLLPGDLIFTGTPGGVGNRMDPPRYLAGGDLLVSRIEGLGELRTAFVQGSSAGAQDSAGGQVIILSNRTQQPGHLNA